MEGKIICSFKLLNKYSTKIYQLDRKYIFSVSHPPQHILSKVRYSATHGSWCDNRESKYLHISSFGQIFSSYVRNDLRYSLRFLNKPCNLDEDFLIEGGKLSKPEAHVGWNNKFGCNYTYYYQDLPYPQVSSQESKHWCWARCCRLGTEGFRKHAKTSCGHPSIHHISNWVIFDKFMFMSVSFCNLQPSSLNINYGI